MENKKEFVPEPPAFKGDVVAVWKATDKNGKLYLKIKVLGVITLNAFLNEPKPKVEAIL